MIAYFYYVVEDKLEQIRPNGITRWFIYYLIMHNVIVKRDFSGCVIQISYCLLTNEWIVGQNNASACIFQFVCDFVYEIRNDRKCRPRSVLVLKRIQNAITFNGSVTQLWLYQTNLLEENQFNSRITLWGVFFGEPAKCRLKLHAQEWQTQLPAHELN